MDGTCTCTCMHMYMCTVCNWLVRTCMFPYMHVHLIDILEIIFVSVSMVNIVIVIPV